MLDHYRPTLSVHALHCILLTIIITFPALAGDNLVAHWSFSNAINNVTCDQSPNSLHAQLLNGASLTPGILGNSLTLDGLDDYASITTPSNSFPDIIGNLDQGTVSFWFKFNRLTEENEIFPVFHLGNGISGPQNTSIIFEVGHFNATNSKLYFTVIANNDVRIPLCFDTGQQLATNTWYQFAASVSPTSNTGYLNGQELTARHYNFGDASSSNFFDDIHGQQVAWIGRGLFASNQTEQYFDGAIDELRIYNQPLTPKQVENQYLETLTGIEYIFDNQPKTLIVNGYSTSYQWPAILQQKIDDYYGITNPDDRIVNVVSAVQGGTPIAKWMDVDTGQPLQPWLNTLRPAIQDAAATGNPVIVLAQQSLQWAFDPNDRTAGINDENDTANIEHGADVFQDYAELLQADGADKVFIASHIYKHTMEPQIGNERYALAALAERELPNVYPGPDVWAVTEPLFPEGFQSDLVHPNEIGAEAMAQAWFDYLLAYNQPCYYTATKGDFNCDSTVDLLDLVTLGQNYNTPNAHYSQGDTNNDQIVDLTDLVTLGENYNKTITPEPATITLLTLISLLITSKRKRLAS